MKPNFIVKRSCELENNEINKIEILLRRLSSSKDESYSSRKKKIDHLLFQLKIMVSEAFNTGLKEGYKMGVDAEQEGQE